MYHSIFPSFGSILTSIASIVHIPLPIIILLGIALLVLVVAVLVFGKKPTEWAYQYGKKNSIMTANERICFEALNTAAGGQYYVFPQVHLSAFLNHKITGQNWGGALHHINQKSVDFVLCDKKEIAPVLAIELDDRSHERPDRRERDYEVQRILKGAGIPILRLKSQNQFNAAELAASIGSE